MGELCKKLGLLVVLPVLIIGDDFEFKAAKSGDALDLWRVRTRSSNLP